MGIHKVLRIGGALTLCAALVACGNRSAQSTTAVRGAGAPASGAAAGSYDAGRAAAGFNYERSSIWDVFGPNRSEQSVQVNRYLWAASMDVLNFLPITSVDPFTGIIVTGYGTPPGGGRAYRATVHISDPALDARSLKVSLQSKSGPVDASTTRAVEDAILSRARQIRTRDKNL